MRYARSQGCIAYKFTSPSRRSVPDRLIVCPAGVHFFIEFKAPGKKPTKAQNLEIGRLRNLGHLVYVCDQKGQAERILDEILTAT